MIETDIAIDWDWVTESFLKKDRITPSSMGDIYNRALQSIDKAKSLVKPGVIFTEKYNFSLKPGSIKLSGGIELTGKTLSEYLKGSKILLVFTVTIGSPLETEASRLMNKGDSLSGYLLDRIGSFAVESLADNLEALVRKKCKLEGQSVSMAFSPGYCDWPIEEQAKLNKILDFSRINVKLTVSFMMVPRKSISGLMGIGPAKLFSGSKSQCEICAMKNCGYRRV